jgi:hypothetical protein
MNMKSYEHICKQFGITHESKVSLSNTRIKKNDIYTVLLTHEKCISVYLFSYNISMERYQCQ